MVILSPEKWVHGGYTIAHKEGKTYFIKGALPQEEVECEILKENSKVVHARVVRVIQPSKERIPSDCVIFPECGGCSFRHIPYEREIELKKILLLEEWQRRSILFVKDVSVTYEKSEHYRNNFQIKLQNQKLGFYKDFSNEIVEIPKTGCKNLTHNLNQILNSTEIQQSLKWRDLNEVYPYDKQDGEYSFEGLIFKVPQNSFFQVNSFLIPLWLKEIRNLIPKGAKVLELFCGCGLISVTISESCKSLLGLEVEESAVRYATMNSKLNSRKNLRFVRLDLYKTKIPYSNFDFLVCNPPRSGLGKKVLEWISERQPRNILYSSCNYLTLTYDLKEILKNGYKLEHVQIFDFFPRTPYFETLVLLQL